ncbi:MAG: hypothetical protein ACTHNQ_13825 [Microbacterium sp.]|uniref:hypothetical protein n=1 Tax=Microbacterium sp. TaxID=51671 RepID=UPI003F7E701D
MPNTVGGNGRRTRVVQGEGEEALRELNEDLRMVGRLPRVLTAILSIVFLPIVWVGWMNSHHSSIALAFAALPIALLLYAVRVRAWATSDTLTVRSYLGTYVFTFADVTNFIDVPYSGMWNRFSGTDTWLNFGVRMIDVALEDGRTVSLPASLTTRPACSRLVDALNARLPQSALG